MGPKKNIYFCRIENVNIIVDIFFNKDLSRQIFAPLPACIIVIFLPFIAFSWHK